MRISKLFSFLGLGKKTVPVVQQEPILPEKEFISFAGQDISLIDPQILRENSKNGDFRGADFYGMDLRGIDFTGAKLNGANLNETTTDHTTKFCDSSLTDLRRWDFEELKLPLVNLDDDFFQMRHTHMENGSHIGTDFTGAHANQLVLDGSDISKAKMLDMNVAGISLKGTICRGTDFTGSYTCLVNGLGQIGPRIQSDSTEMEGAVTDATTTFDKKLFSNQVEPDENGDIQVQMGPVQITFRDGPGMMI